ncbi:hypothetical protein NMG60_11003329 [Bertholletia excelsa]
MDQIKPTQFQNPDPLSKFPVSKKKSIQILLSISLFYFLFSCFPQLDLFTLCSRYTGDRNYAFLFFNGILVFLITNSGLAAATCPPIEADKKHHLHHHQSVPESRVAEEKKTLVRKEVADGGEAEELVTEEREIEEDEEEEEVVFGMEKLSAEDLKRKCDDFIRRMKEGIKFEA